jgi:hypothetical protein
LQTGGGFSDNFGVIALRSALSGPGNPLLPQDGTEGKSYMETFEVGEGVDSLLKELHEKKRWLDMMISGLEAAVDSPEHRLIELAEKTFEENAAKAPRVDLENEGKTALTMLASSVGATPHARRRRSVGRYAVKT